MTPLRAGIAAAAAALIADQGTKTLLLYGFGFAHLGPGKHIEVLPFFDLVMVWNRGISYGLLQPHGISGTWLLTFFSLAATVALGWWLTSTERVFPAIGLGLVIGGALGNVVDKSCMGRWPIFSTFMLSAATGMCSMSPTRPLSRASPSYWWTLSPAQARSRKFRSNAYDDIQIGVCLMRGGRARRLSGR